MAGALLDAPDHDDPHPRDERARGLGLLARDRRAGTARRTAGDVIETPGIAHGPKKGGGRGRGGQGEFRHVGLGDDDRTGLLELLDNAGILSRNAILRIEFRDYLTKVPKVFAASPGARISGLLHQWVPAIGISWTF